MFTREYAEWVKDELLNMECLVSGWTADREELDLIEVCLNNIDYLLSNAFKVDTPLNHDTDTLINKYLGDVRDFTLAIARSYGL